MNLINNYFANDNYPLQVNAIPLCDKLEIIFNIILKES